MQMTMGPVTTGGKKRMTRLGPNTLNSAESTRYRSPEHATPRQAYGNRSASPLGAMAAYPAMKANDDPRNAGTFPFESRWNNSVPTPANSSVVETGRPVRTGTKIVAPNMANMCCSPKIAIFGAPSLRAS